MNLFDATVALCTGAATDQPGWIIDPWVSGPLVSCGGLYCLGVARLWRRAGIGRGIQIWQAIAYAAGWLTVAVTLLSPLHWTFERLFTFHMIEHELLIAAAAPLIALSNPVAAIVWGLSPRWRRSFGRSVGTTAARTLWTSMRRPWTATILHGAAIWIWHVPALFDAAVLDPTLHRLQHLSFTGSAVLFWWCLTRRSDLGAAAGHLVVTMLHTGLLGAFIALSPRVLYPIQTGFASYWGLSPLEDQQLAGFVMWIPAGTIYAGAALYFLGRWISRSGTVWSRVHALRQA